MPHPLVVQLRFTRGEWKRSLAGITDSEARQRFGPMNCLSWNIGHLAWQEQRCLRRADELPSATRATVTYVFTGLTEQGNEYVGQYTDSHYQHWIQGWEAAINTYLCQQA